VTVPFEYRRKEHEQMANFQRGSGSGNAAHRLCKN